MKKKLLAKKDISLDEEFQKAAILVNNDDFSGAYKIYSNILCNIPDNPRALHALGVVSYRLGKGADEAVSLVQQALCLKPDYLDAYLNLRKILIELRRFDDAEECYQRALAVQPDSAYTCMGLGNICCQKQCFVEALLFYRKAVEYLPDAKAFVALGNVLYTLGRAEEAATAFRDALAVHTDCGEAFCGLATVYDSTKNFASAEEYAQKALKLLPSSIHCMQVMASIYRASGRVDEAIDWYRSAVHSGGGQAAISKLLFAMNFSSRVSQDEILAISRQWEADSTVNTKTLHGLYRLPGRLRVGYVSPDFKKHVLAFFLEPLLSAHNRKRFEIHCYSNVLIPDNVTDKLKSYAEYWHDIRSLSDEEVVSKIRADRIDILIDLTGHLTDNRLCVFSQRAAPVQMTWLGYPNTTGLPAMDYRITDAVADPPGASENQHSEQLIRLPDCFLCYQPPDDPPDVTPPPALLNGFVTFGCFNYPAKITQDVIALWSTVLLMAPNSLLLFKSPSFCDPVLAERFSAQFVTYGVPSGRVLCIPAKESFLDHLATYSQIDIALDPFPYNGTTTTFEALYMGVPVVTLRGNRHAGRVGASILTSLGVTELIAENVNEYTTLAVSLANDQSKLAAYHKELRHQLVSSVLCNASQFSEALEEVYSTAWRAYSHAHPSSIPLLDEIFLKAQMFARQGEYLQAGQLYERILIEQPDNVRALHGMGAVCHWMADSESAISHINRALQLKPDYPVALAKLGNVYKETGRVNEAIDCYKQVLTLDPGFSEIHSNILMGMQYLSEYSGNDIFKESKRWSDYHARSPFQQLSNKKRNVKKTGKIRVGFVSADFRLHPVGFFIFPFLSKYDHEQFELVCYSNSSWSDNITEQIIALTDIWRVIEGVSDRAAWQMIQDDAIDILVDLSGHTAGNRLLLFSMRAAPVQITWLGYPGTSGISAMDYRISDTFADPEGESEVHYSERLLRLPNCFLCYHPPNSAPDNRPSLPQHTRCITFGSFNNISKIGKEVIIVWCHILRAVPNSRLLLKSRAFCDRTFADSFSGWFTNQGITAERLICVSAKESFSNHLATYNQIDIALDSFPYNGTTTTFEALYMGVPVITLRGNRHAGRVGASILTNAGLADLVAETVDEYTTLAVCLANDLSRLSLYHAKLRHQIVSSVLCDAMRFTEAIQNVFRNVWQRYNDTCAAVTPCQSSFSEPASVTIPCLFEKLEIRCAEAAQLVDAGKLAEAETVYMSVLADTKEYPRALHALGVVRYRRGHREKGIELVRRALALKPDYIEAVQNLGRMLHEQGYYLEAFECYQRVVSIMPGDQNSLFLMALLLSKAGEKQRAIAEYERLIALAPDHFDGIFNLGKILMEERNFEDAKVLLERAKQLMPENAGVLLTLGNFSLNVHDTANAELFYMKACKFDPKNAEAHTNLGHLFTQLKQFKKAITYCKRAVALKPDFAIGYANLGCALEKSGQIKEAIEAYQKAIELDATFSTAHSSLIMLIHYVPNTTPDMVYQMSRQWDSMHAEKFKNLWNSRCHGTRDKKLKIGFVSPDFRRHPVTYFILPFFRFHNRDKFELFCYSDVIIEDDFTCTLRNEVDNWRAVHATDNASLNRIIRDDSIDILVDLAGHTAGNRLLLFAMKPAAVQVTWAGYVGSTGLSSIDYLISDRFQSPEGSDQYASEHIIRIPDDYICYSPPEFAPEISPLPALANGYVTFGVFNNLAKITTEVLTLWAEILKHVKGSRIFIKNPSFDDPFVKERYLALFAKNSISSERIITEGQSPPDEMLARYSLVDIQLDTFPYNGGLTTLESLWMGVPVVTLPGELFSSRHSLSHLMNIGLNDCIATSSVEYVVLACHLAKDLERLSALRTTLRQKMYDSPLCNGVVFTDNLQRVFRDMWCARCAAVGADNRDNDLPQRSVDHVVINEQGNRYSDNGDFDAAIKCFKNALEIKPGYVEAYYNMGLVQYKKRNIAEAISLFNKAISLAPDFIEAYVNLSNLYLSVGMLEQAITICHNAISIVSDSPDIYNNIGSALMKMGNLSGSLSAFRKALELKPDYHQVHSNILFILHSIPQMNEKLIFDESRNWDIRHSSTKKYSHVPGDYHCNSVLRIGFVSADFRLHPVGYFLKSFMMLHNRSRFELFCYSDVRSNDQLTKFYRESSKKFREIFRLDDTEVAEIVFGDKIDILVDLAGHTNGNRLKVFTMNPAPVQVSWAGYVGTTGLSSIDYLISDRFQSPEGSDAFATESIIRMPNDYISYTLPEDSPRVSLLPAYKNGYITFGSFNKPSKISDETVALWAEVLQRVEGSRLFMKNESFSDRLTIERYSEIFSTKGITNDRLIFEGPASHYEMLASYSKVDIQLDTFPYSGGLTTLESLWMGVPVVTLPGELFSSRHSLSHLMNVGLGECVASSREEYIEIASRLADNFEILSTLRAGLRSRLINSPVCDGKLFTYNLQQAFVWMWRTWYENSFDSPLFFSKDDDPVKLVRENSVDPVMFKDDFSKGLECIRRKDFLEAAERFEAVLVSDPDNADAHNNLGIAYFEIGFKDDALDEFKIATKLAPNNAEAWKNLGKAIRDTNGNAEKAARCFRKAVFIAPDFDDAWMMLGNAVLDGGRVEQAIKFFKKSMELNPHCSDVHSNLLFALNYLPQFPQKEIYLESCRWEQQHSGGMKLQDHMKRERNQRLLRIGYVSGDFKRHPVGYHIQPVLAAHNLEQFEIYCYATTREQDDVTEILQGYVYGWRDISKLSDTDATKLICADQIDILVDLSGHTGGNRLPLFAGKPAPIQLSWLGYFNTTGLKAIDYLISDATTIPAKDEQWFTEKILRLPGCRFCYAPPEYSPSVVAPPAKDNGYITFGSFNNIAKLNQYVIELWSLLLIALPEAKLIIKWRGLERKKERDRLMRQFVRHGVEAERIVLRGRSPHREMLKEYGDIDIALDPFPFSGGMTSCEALWMGVPVLTLLGDLPSGRQTAAFLNTIGLPEWVTNSQEQFINKATECVTNIEKLEILRFAMRGKMLNSTLCDGARFTRNLERLYSEIIQEYNLALYSSSTIHNDNKKYDYLTAAEYYNNAIDQMEAGNNDQAISLFELAIASNPHFAMAYNNLGIIQTQIGKIDEARESFKKAISVDPNFSEFFYNLGLLYEKEKCFHEAIKCFDTAISLNSEYGEAYLEKGNALSYLGELYSALECYRNAAERMHESAIVSNNIGTVYQKLEKNQDAELFFREALLYDPDYVPAYGNLSTLFYEMGLVMDAERAASAGLAIFPDNISLLLVHAMATTAQARVSESLQGLHRALVVNPYDPAVRSSFIYLLQYLNNHSLSAIREEHKKWAELHVTADAFLRTFPNVKDPDRKLVIGYLSPDFCRHPVGFFVMPVLQSHNRKNFNIICYSDSDKTDVHTLMLESNADVWHETSCLSDQALLELIVSDGIDILVDLAGHTAGNRLTLFAQKAAPIQISWLGYPDSTGLPTIDYRITDVLADPDTGYEVNLTEQLIRLPNGFHCYLPPSDAPDIGSPPSQVNGFITFGCFNNLAKVTPEVIDLWANILLAISGSRLLLKSKSFSSPEFVEKFAAAFIKRGITSERIQCVPDLKSSTDHLELYRQMDIALDPFPYNGTATTFEALYMGVPVIALHGERHAGRVSASILGHLGLGELLAETKDHYYSIAVLLSADITRLSIYHANLRNRLLASPFVDAEVFTHALENTYRQVWQTYIATSVES